MKSRNKNVFENYRSGKRRGKGGGGGGGGRSELSVKSLILEIT